MARLMLRDCINDIVFSLSFLPSFASLLMGLSLRSIDGANESDRFGSLDDGGTDFSPSLRTTNCPHVDAPLYTRRKSRGSREKKKRETNQLPLVSFPSTC